MTHKTIFAAREHQMTKKDMAKMIAGEFVVPVAAATKIVQQVFDLIVQSLEGEGRIEMRNFGVFEVKTRRARQARNPRTGEQVLVPERVVVAFKSGRQMLERIRQMASGARRQR
jgi:nucleoid DNA-binding protein